MYMNTYDVYGIVSLQNFCITIILHVIVTMFKLLKI
jgi:hypothetical protein